VKLAQERSDVLELKLWFYTASQNKTPIVFLDPEGGLLKDTVVDLVPLVGISSLKNPKATKRCIHIRADIPHRSTVSDF